MEQKMTSDALKTADQAGSWRSEEREGVRGQEKMKGRKRKGASFPT
jgi:hypothetical protein